MIKLDKIYRKKFPGIPESRDSREIFDKFFVSREVENPGKRETLTVISEKRASGKY